MATVKNQTAPVTSAIGENQRRLLLEVLRANLRAKNMAAAGMASEQQGSVNQPRTRPPAPVCADLTGASALAGAAGFRPALAQKLEWTVKGPERDMHSTTAAKDNVAWQLRAARTAAADRDGTRSTGTGLAGHDERGRADTVSSDLPAAAQYAPAERAAEEGGGQQGLSVALFAKLAEGLPKDQGKLHFLTWADGSCYCGHMTGGSLDGVGVYRYTDNSIYCGQWVRDHLQGYGAFITPSGFLYRGHFEADKQHGEGWSFGLSRRYPSLPWACVFPYTSSAY